MEAARRASIADEEACKIRLIESAAGASSSRDVETARGTTNSVVADQVTTEGAQTKEVVGSGNRIHQLADRHLPLSYFNFFMHWGQLHIFLLGVG